ncbi:hypothetical protein AB1Y20_001683 [Prymnesium parvum]|uniref:Phospholipid/glycerol acyltransferase domain-containing protein n=1 Tax=Prymnesium parvum TaxID=97485 RepID=A0AB34KBW4_PRYPA
MLSPRPRLLLLLAMLQLADARHGGGIVRAVVRPAIQPRPCLRSSPTMAAFSPRLVWSEAMLKLQRLLDPELVLHRLPKREIIQSEHDIYAVADAFPGKYRAQFVEWYEGYREQVMRPPPAGPGLSEEELMTIFNRIVDRMLLLSRQPFSFESRHETMEQPYNYFEFGQEYMKPLINFDHSYLRNPENWAAAKSALERGENVVLLANHQSEADAAFMPHFFARSSPDWAQFGRSVYYVAGDRVVADPLVQPFSMGRNLFCVHSKKYLASETDEAVRAAKSKQNKRTLMEMNKAFKKGGIMIWVAPAGGRDRKNAEGRPTPAEWDPAVVEMFRSLGEKSGVVTHLFPMAMATYAIMPPPDGRNKALGEQRITRYSGCGLSLGVEADLSAEAPWRSSHPDPKVALCDHLYKLVCEEYDLIEKVMLGFQPEGSTYRPPNAIQPWVTPL